MSWAQWIDHSKSKCANLDQDTDALPWDHGTGDNFVAEEELHPGPLDAGREDLGTESADTVGDMFKNENGCAAPPEELYDDAFAMIDIDGNEIPAGVQANANASTEWTSKVSGLHITSSTSVRSIANQIKINFPKRRWIYDPNAYGALDYITLDTDKILERKKMLVNMNVNQVHAIAWWLNRTPFSAASSTIAPCDDHTTYQCTYPELALAIEMDTGVGLGGPCADLHAKSDTVVKILRFLVSTIGVQLNGEKSRQSFKSLFAPRLMKCTRDVTGVWLNGINRRPVWIRHDDTELATAANLCLAKQHSDNQKSSNLLHTHVKDVWRLFGKGFTPKTRCFSLKPLWLPPPLVELQSLLMDKLQDGENARPTQAKCFFGHFIAAKPRTQNLVPMWRGPVHGAQLCIACHRKMTHELNDKNQPLVVKYGGPLSIGEGTDFPTGPCVFGHVHSSAQGIAGTPLWFRLPTGVQWNGAVAGDVLCNACHVRFRRKRSRDSDEVMYATHDHECYQYNEEKQDCGYDMRKLTDITNAQMDTAKSPPILCRYRIQIAGIYIKQSLGRLRPNLNGFLSICYNVKPMKTIAEYLGIHSGSFLCDGLVIMKTCTNTRIRLPTTVPHSLRTQLKQNLERAYECEVVPYNISDECSEHSRDSVNDCDNGASYSPPLPPRSDEACDPGGTPHDLQSVEPDNCVTLGLPDFNVSEESNSRVGLKYSEISSLLSFPSVKSSSQRHWGDQAGEDPGSGSDGRKCRATDDIDSFPELDEFFNPSSPVKDTSDSVSMNCNCFPEFDSFFDTSNEDGRATTASVSIPLSGDGSTSTFKRTRHLDPDLLPESPRCLALPQDPGAESSELFRIKRRRLLSLPIRACIYPSGRPPDDS